MRFNVQLSRQSSTKAADDECSAKLLLTKLNPHVVPDDVQTFAPRHVPHENYHPGHPPPDYG